LGVEIYRRKKEEILEDVLQLIVENKIPEE
jgi:hypothetical protein